MILIAAYAVGIILFGISVQDAKLTITIRHREFVFPNTWYWIPIRGLWFMVMLVIAVVHDFTIGLFTKRKWAKWR